MLPPRSTRIEFRGGEGIVSTTAEGLLPFCFSPASSLCLDLEMPLELLLLLLLFLIGTLPWITSARMPALSLLLPLIVLLAVLPKTCTRFLSFSLSRVVHSNYDWKLRLLPPLPHTSILLPCLGLPSRHSTAVFALLSLPPAAANLSRFSLICSPVCQAETSIIELL